MAIYIYISIYLGGTFEQLAANHNLSASDEICAPSFDFVKEISTLSNGTCQLVKRG